MCGSPVFVAVARIQGVPLAMALSIRSRISSVMVIIGMTHPLCQCGAAPWGNPGRSERRTCRGALCHCAIIVDHLGSGCAGEASCRCRTLMASQWEDCVALRDP